jgi:hypothetical protein
MQMILDHPVVSQAWTCQTAWRHLEVPAGGSQGVQRGAYPWLLQGAHKGYRGAPTPGSFRDLTGGTGAPIDPSEISQEEHGCLTCLIKDADWGYLGQLPSAAPLGGSSEL